MVVLGRDPRARARAVASPSVTFARQSTPRMRCRALHEQVTVPRYYEVFFVADPMREISKTEALEATSYAVEADIDSTRRYQIWVRGELDLVVYPNAEPTAQIAALQRTHDSAVPSWITSAPIRDGEELRYAIWYFEPGGRLEKRVDTVVDSRLRVETWYDAQGRLGGTLERHYNEDGEQIEVVATRPGGQRVVVDD